MPANQSVAEEEVESTFAATPPSNTTDPNSTSIAERFAGGEPRTPSGSRWGLPDGPVIPDKPTTPPPPKTTDENATKSSTDNGQPDASAPKTGQEGDALLSEDEIEKLKPEGRDAGRAWKTLKSEHKKAVAALKARNDEIKALQSQAKEPQTPAELAEIQRQLETTRKERDDISNVLKSALYQHSPEFQARFEGRRKALLDLAQETLPRDTFEKAKEIFKLAPGDYRDGLLTELGEALPRATQSRLDSLALEFDKVGLEYRGEVAEAAKRYDEYQASQKAANKKTLDYYNKLFLDRLARIQDPKSGECLDIYARSQDPARQQEINDMVDVARRAFNGGLPEDQLVTLQLWGAALPNYIKRMAAVTKQRDDALKELESLKTATPSIGKGKEEAERKNFEPQEGKSFASVLARLNPGGKIPRS